MNGINKITDQIGADIQKDIDSLMERTRAQAAEIAHRYEERAGQEGAAVLERGRKAAAEHEERLVSNAKLEARKQILAAKQELVEQAFDTALEQLLALPEEYTALLASLAAKAADTGREKVALSQKDRARYGKAAVTRANELLGDRGHLTLSEGTRDIRGGLILEGDQVEVNCSFETLIRGQKEAATAQVARILFEQAP